MNIHQEPKDVADRIAQMTHVFERVFANATAHGDVKCNLVDALNNIAKAIENHGKKED